MKKRQFRKVGVAGGFFNQIMGNNYSEPVVGEGATILHYSDRSAYEVIEVSENGMSCKIRKMKTKFIGACYGDEKYKYISNPESPIITLEWNEKKRCWGSVYYKNDIIKSLRKNLCKQYGWDWIDYLPNGVKLKDIQEVNQWGDINFKLVDGITKRYKVFNKLSIIFGIMEEYRDPHF